MTPFLNTQGQATNCYQCKNIKKIKEICKKKHSGLSRGENKITILIPDPTFSWQQHSVSLETNLEACEQCGPGLLISADTRSHYPGLGAKPKTAHANPEKGASQARAV